MKSGTDVLVVGGGVIGLACAYSLARSGVEVTLLEAGDLGHGASGACDGFLHLQTKRPGTHAGLARASLDMYRAIAGRLGEDLEFRQPGGLVVAFEPGQMRWLKRRGREQARHGTPVNLLSSRELLHLEPALSPELAGAAYGPRDGHVNPWKVVLGLERGARENGAQIVSGAPVEGFETRGAAVKAAVTAQERFRCRRLLLAAGAWTRALGRRLGLQIPLWPRKGQILVTESVRPLMRHPLVCADYVGFKGVAGLGELGHPGSGKSPGMPGGLSLEQAADGKLLLGSTRDWAGFDGAVTLEAMRAIATRARRVAPGLANVQVLRAFSGFRPSTGDGLPLVGHLPGWSNALIAAGHEGDGLALAPATGHLVMQIVRGEKPDWPVGALAPERTQE